MQQRAWLTERSECPNATQGDRWHRPLRRDLPRRDAPPCFRPWSSAM